MPALPRISVVIPCYNAAHYLPTTLNSVMSQVGFDVEILMVDDGSTDGSSALVESAFPTVRVLRQTNQGVAVARNNGVDQSSHPWVAFIDADDVWLPGKLRAQWALLQQHPEARMVYSAWQVWNVPQAEPDPEQLAFLIAASQSVNCGTGSGTCRWQGPTGWIYPELLSDCVVWTSTVLVQRSLLQELGGFDPHLKVGEDYDLWLRASRLTPILKVPRPLALYRHHSANITQRMPERNYRAEVVGRALAQWGYVGPDGRQADQRLVNASLARSWADFAGARLVEGDASGAAIAARASVAMHKFQWLGWKVWAKAAFRSLDPTR